MFCRHPCGTPTKEIDYFYGTSRKLSDSRAHNGYPKLGMLLPEINRDQANRAKEVSG